MTETPPEQQQQQEPAPPWGSPEEFNPEKAWKLIQDLRSDKEKLAARPVLDEAAQQRLAELDRLEQASKTELERKTEEVTRWQDEAQKWRSASVSSRIEALAATDFEYPDDAVTALRDNNYLDAGGQIDTEAIKADLAKLLEAKPRWRRQTDPQQPRLPQPNPAQGSSGNGAGATDPAQQFAALLQGKIR